MVTRIGLTFFLLTGFALRAQSGAGAVGGTVTDPTGAVVRGAAVELHNHVTGYKEENATDEAGSFRFTNVPFNPYHVTVTAPGFSPAKKDISVRSTVPVTLKFLLELAEARTTLTVEAADLLENVPVAHNDLDRSTFSKLPVPSPGSGLSDAITLGAPGVVADSNGFFHPLGDHAQTSFSVDGQPISDQQSKAFSTQIPLDAIQSMELITGAPDAEYGDKTSLVVSATTRSGLGQAKPFGSFVAEYGSFGTLSEESTLGLGTPKFGNFLAVNALRSGRFLDTPEFRPIHAIGNNGTIFDRIDYQPTVKNTFHLNLFSARNWFQTPNTYDQPGQDQKQRVLTYNISPGYQRVFNARTLLTLDTFVRRDQVNYYSSRDPFNDAPATISQGRFLTNYGLKGDIAYVRGAHNIKVGTQLMRTHLSEGFALGITSPDFDLTPGLAPFNLTRGGRLFEFHDKGNVNQFAFFAQDAITVGKLKINAGLRVDRYNGLSQATGVQPRIGLSYLLKRTGTVLRAAYSRTFETPYNENLLLSSATGQGGFGANVFGAFEVEPLKPGNRNQFNAGLEQAFGRFVRVTGDYFWKFTDNAYDFGVLLNTPITFPISWRKSKIDGVSLRLSTLELAGFQASTNIGHTRARFFGPEVGGLIFNSPVDASVFRIDHDQAFQQTTNIRYQRPNQGPWVAFTWRYDSGLVAGEVASVEDALALTAAQQAAIGFYCGSQRASLGNPITRCESGGGATRLRIPAPGTADDDHNPPRIAPRHLFDLGVGTDNLFHRERVHTTLKFTVVHLTNRVALYNFLSTFTGTHFVTPRAYQAAVGIVF